MLISSSDLGRAAMHCTLPRGYQEAKEKRTTPHIKAYRRWFGFDIGSRAGVSVSAFRHGWFC